MGSSRHRHVRRRLQLAERPGLVKQASQSTARELCERVLGHLRAACGKADHGVAGGLEIQENALRRSAFRWHHCARALQRLPQLHGHRPRSLHLHACIYKRVLETDRPRLACVILGRDERLINVQIEHVARHQVCLEVGDRGEGRHHRV